MSRRVLITGASGFMGSNLARRLVHDGAGVALLVREVAGLSDDLRERCKLIQITDDLDGWGSEVADFDPDTCFHLAAQSIPVHTRADVAPLLQANVVFGTLLLEVLSGGGSAVDLVNVGSVWQHHDSRRYGPTSLYAATKQAFVDVLQYYAECTQLNAVTIECPDTYGPNDRRGKLLQLLRRATETGEPVRLSPGGQMIEMLHIEDVVEALLCSVGFAGPEANSYQITGEVMTLREFVELVGDVLGAPVPVDWGARPYRQRETMQAWRYNPPLPGWRPTRSLSEGLPEALVTQTTSQIPTPRAADIRVLATPIFSA